MYLSSAIPSENDLGMMLYEMHHLVSSSVQPCGRDRQINIISIQNGSHEYRNVPSLSIRIQRISTLRKCSWKK